MKFIFQALIWFLSVFSVVWKSHTNRSLGFLGYKEFEYENRRISLFGRQYIPNMWVQRAEKSGIWKTPQEGPKEQTFYYHSTQKVTMSRTAELSSWAKETLPAVFCGDEWKRHSLENKFIVYKQYKFMIYSVIPFQGSHIVEYRSELSHHFSSQLYIFRPFRVNMQLSQFPGRQLKVQTTRLFTFDILVSIFSSHSLQITHETKLE